MSNESIQSDQAIMHRIVDGDQQALADLYDRYGGGVFSLILQVLNDTGQAEEVTQDVFMRVWHGAEKWDANRGKLSSWLLTIARHAAIDRLRMEKRRYNIADTPLDNMPAKGSENWAQRRQIKSLLTLIPPEQAQLIELSYYGGMSHQDIADTTQTPLGTVKTRIRSGMQKLRKLWLENAD
ncbi:MAG: hypothetical protein CL607_07035 [Anaerolineaceae bacterium]|nr:hypothetical protein [Anaerolineaceae bacterium]